MNNVRKLSVFLLLSAGVNNVVLATGSGCSSDCSVSTTTSMGMGSGCNNSSNDCNMNNGSNDCNMNNNGSSDCSTDGNTNCIRNCSKTFRARPIVGNLTYRNDLTYFNRYHDARCNFFTWDSTLIYERNRHRRCTAAGIFGTRNGTLVVAENGTGDINSLWLDLGSNTPEGFMSTVTVRPRRRVISWLSQLIFNLDSCCTGLWFDFSYAVTNARHRLHLREMTNSTNDIVGGPANVTTALMQLGLLPRRCRRTSVDDAVARLGYDYSYCGEDHVGFYLLGYIPTGRRRHNIRLFEPTVGTKNGGIGAGFTADYTAWNDECNTSALVLMTELKYTFMFRHRECRLFDLCNKGPLSHFFEVAPQSNPFAPQPILPFLTQRVRVHPRSTIDWWLGLHYQYCNWGGELDYTLFWKQREKIRHANFNFDSFGIFDINSCGNLTTASNATIAGAVGSSMSDAVFTPLTLANVNIRSAEACRALTHTVSGAVSYNSVWCDCYPWYLGLGGNVEFASRRQRRSNFENWGVFGKAAISF